MPRILLCALLFAVISAMASPAFAWMTPPALNPANGHYYAFFNASDEVKYDRRVMSFDLALSRAASMSHLGIPGHLVTITSQAEQDFLYERFLQHTTGGHQAPFSSNREFFWIAASDAAVEGEWRWIAGPETGQMFWKGNYQGEALGYQDWASYEPNDTRGVKPIYNPTGEHVIALRVSASAPGPLWQTSWNDVNADGIDPTPGDPVAIPRLGIVEFSPVPEPSAGALIASAGLLLLSSRRSRR